MHCPTVHPPPLNDEHKEPSASVRAHFHMKVLFFQDVVPLPTHRSQHEEEDNEDELSLAFFELANVRFVGYRLDDPKLIRKKRKKTTDSPLSIVVRQDPSACGQHTGGIVWETSYLLISYLLSRQNFLGRTLEVGAGCGLLGQVLAGSGWAQNVVLTESAEVMVNLLNNIEQNKSTLCRKGRELAVGRQLDWEHPERDMERHPKDLRPHSFDTIVGTDVVFTPKLVEPLLITLRLMSHDATVIYLCLQVRCPDSHRLLLERAADHQWAIEDVSEDLASIPECSWGLHLGCCLLRFIKFQDKNGDSIEHSDKKWKERDGKQSKSKKQKKHVSYHVL